MIWVFLRSLTFFLIYFKADNYFIIKYNFNVFIQSLKIMLYNNKMEYDDIVKSINEKVNNISGEDINIAEKLSIFNINRSYVYCGLFVVLTYLTLYLIKPEFVTTTDTVFDGEIYLEKKISHKKIITISLIITLLIYVSYFAYKYKKIIKF